ncbi:MAG: Na+:solute symporter [Bacteroidales bacterium]|nr:Na+:solute symporter [Bacteroidales bacterium]
MHLATLDILIIVAYFLVSLAIGIYMSRRAGRSTGDFFLGGRNLPWYIAGTSMVATTFAADTPLAVTELVAQKGISGNWLWWNMLFGGMLTVFFFARLWRRAKILTDAEFVSIRYAGKEASFLRGFRAVYIGIFMNIIVIAWVNLALVKILQVLFPEFLFFGSDHISFAGFHFSSHLLLTGSIMIFVALYSALSGLWGISLTDSFQFVIAMAGCIILAIVAVNHQEVGGIDNVKRALPEEVFNFVPSLEKGENQVTGVLQLSVLAFIAYIGVQWWASWYPGAEPGGGGYVAQRMMSARDEKHSLLATLWFQIAHFALRPWPWIVVALVALTVLAKAPDKEFLQERNPWLYALSEKASMDKDFKRKVSGFVVQEDNTAEQVKLADSDIQKVINQVNRETGKEYNSMYLSKVDYNAYYEKWENTTDPGRMFPKLMVRYLPAGLLGLLIAAFLAAYMSTIASQTNWGTSYIVNDLYRPFVKPKATEKYYVKVSRITTFLLMLLSLLLTSQLDKISTAWKIVLALSGGIGPVLILRWFWWRINAWSEISAMLAPYLIFPVLTYGMKLDLVGADFEKCLLIIVGWSSLVWLVVTFLTKPAPEEKLMDFYRKVHPGGIGWESISQKLPDVKSDTGYRYLFMNWILGCILVMASLFGFGKLIFKEYNMGIAFLVVAVISGFMIFKNLNKMGWEKMK